MTRGASSAFALAPGDAKLTAAILSDALDAAGRPGQVAEPGIGPLTPGRTVFGRAATLQFAPTCAEAEPTVRDGPDPPGPYDDVIEFIDALRAGDVVVLATANSHRSAFWGELFTAAAIGHGAVGVVCDGCLRDTAKITDQGFPAFARGRRPLDFKARMRVIGTAVPVDLAGVVVHPGDLIFADDDGIVVIPQDIEADVLNRARQRAAAEGTVLQDLLAGDALRTVWERHHIL